jgi:MFS family permease
VGTGLLRHRNFLLLWTGETISLCGSALSTVVMALIVVTVLHGSTFALTAVSAASSVPWLVIGLPAGVWVDRLPVRRLMIACDLVQALLFMSVPLAAWAGVLTVAQVVVVALLAGTANVLFSTAYQVLLPHLVSGADLVEGNAKLQGSSSVASIMGRGGSGLLVGPLGILLNSLSFVVSAVCLVFIRESGAPRARRRGGRVRDGLRYIATDPYLRAITGSAAVGNAGFSGSAALFVVFLVRVARLPAGDVGFLLAFSGFGGILGAVIARRLAGWMGTARTLWLVRVLTGVSAVVLVPSGSAFCFALGAVLLGVGVTIGNVIAQSFRQAYCPEVLLARVVSAMRFVGFGASPLGALLAGALGTVLGVRPALWIMLSVYAAAALPLLTPTILSASDLPLPRPRLVSCDQ